MAPDLMQLLEQHHQDSWGWALACCRWDQCTAEDALQESYLRVLDGRARFAGLSTSKTWFFAIVKHVSSELLRRQTRQGLLNFTHLVPADDCAADPSFDAAGEDQANLQLRQVLTAMPQRQREVIHLVFYAGLTLEEAAQTLGMGLGTARTHYHRGKARLAELLELPHG